MSAGRLDHVHWIGGGSGAGKSTIARRLAADHGLQLYDTDQVISDHVGRADRSAAPYLHEFLDMGMDQRWVTRSPAEMLETFHWFRGEGFELIVDDLRSLSNRGGVIAEGFRLLPSLVEPLLDESRSAVWILPTPEFRRRAFERRVSLWAIAGRTGNPERALRNLLERDGLFTERLRDELEHLGLSAIDVDVGTTESELYGRVRACLALPEPGH